MRAASIAVLVSILFLTTGSAQERLFRAADRQDRTAVSSALTEALALHANLPITISLAARAGLALPEGSKAAQTLRRSLQVANATSNGDLALQRLRSEIGDLTAVLDFTPKMEAELPEGFPGFGAVDEIELRDYPAYRMARTEMRRGSTGAFWPLFQHIQSNDIAMTTPVQMDWGSDDAASRPVNMAFLYGSTAISPDSTAKGIKVVEIPAQSVLTIGAIGNDHSYRVTAMGSRLNAFLAAPSCPLESCGPLRTMGYNSPMVRGDSRYFEVQIPVRPRAF